MIRNLIAFSLLLLLLWATAQADVAPLKDSADFEKGKLGAFPHQTYNSSDVLSPLINFVSYGNQYPDPDLCTVISLRGHKVQTEAHSPMIFDNKGTLIWASTQYNSYDRSVYGTNVQEYKGQKYITFWSGDDEVRGHGQGVYYMLDSSYREYKVLRAGNGLRGDLHEFTITRNGTAIITVYQIVQADLRSFNPEAPDPSYIWDSIFQEIDLETDKVLFQWRASDHYAYTASFRPVWPDGTFESPWDWFHINSVEKDEHGNYLISSRYLSMIAYIRGVTGEVAWNLGGKLNDFTDLSDGSATDFRYQHHARWRDDRTQLTLFDNAADFTHPHLAEHSRGMRLAINITAKTVELLTVYVHPLKIVSTSQGSLQYLPNGNILIGWGGVPAMTEFTIEGEVVRDFHFGPSFDWGHNNVQSYRGFQHHWVGNPADPPEVSVYGNISYVSWNGATKVRAWKMQEKHTHWADFKTVDSQGFETVIHFDGNKAADQIKFLALDADGAVLGESRTVTRSEEPEYVKTEEELVREARSRILPIILAALAICAAAELFRRTFAWWLRRRRLRRLSGHANGAGVNGGPAYMKLHEAHGIE